MSLIAEDTFADIEKGCVGDQFVNEEISSLEL